MNCVKLSSLKERERKKERECFVLVSDFLCVCFLSPFALELYFPGLLHIHFICSHIISFPVAEPVWPDLAKFCHFVKVFLKLWPFRDGLFSIWQNFETNLAILYAITVANGQMLNKFFSHLVTLYLNYPTPISSLSPPLTTHTSCSATPCFWPFYDTNTRT